jgi:hypothetical protein
MKPRGGGGGDGKKAKKEIKTLANIRAWLRGAILLAPSLTTHNGFDDDNESPKTK